MTTEQIIKRAADIQGAVFYLAQKKVHKEYSNVAIMDMNTAFFEDGTVSIYVRFTHEIDANEPLVEELAHYFIGADEIEAHLAKHEPPRTNDGA